MLPPNQMMPAPAYPMTDQKAANAAVMPQKFWIKTKEVNILDAAGRPTGQTKYVNEEWVTVAKIGVTIPATVDHNIASIKKGWKRNIQQHEEAEGEMAALWRTVEPYYENWKKGGEASEIINGTPLAVWPGVTKDVVEALKPFNIRSVEDLSQVNDTVMNRIPNPSMHLYRERAKKFLATKDIALVVAELTNRDDELAQMKAEMASLKNMLAASEFAKKEAEGERDDAVPAVARRRKAKAEAA